MFFPRLIRWIAGLPAPYALGLLWWGEALIYLCSLMGGYTFSRFLFDKLPPSWQPGLFPLALLTYFLVFYMLHITFGKVSELMEALVNIHRYGGLDRVECLLADGAVLEQPESDTGNGETEDDPDEIIDPFEAPDRIRASAEQFKVRYFVVLPTILVLYLLSYAVTIYRIFARQVQSWEPGSLVMPALTTSLIGCFCYWLLMPHIPGYVSVRGLLGRKVRRGE